MLASCTQQGALLSDAERQDSLALHVAVLPVEDCLPVYYAQRMGLFDSCQVDIRLIEYLSQMDCDTALLTSRCELGYTAMLRIMHHEALGDTLCPLLFCTGRYALVAHDKRANRLQGKMISIARNAAPDYWLDQAITKLKLTSDDIYRPQINDIRLRQSMFNQQLVEGTMLPEPYVTQALADSCHVLYAAPDSTLLMTCWATQPQTYADSSRKEQIERFLTAYRQSAACFSEGTAQPDTLANILREQYHLTDSAIVRLTYPKFIHTKTNEADSRAAFEQWYKSRNIRTNDR